MELPAPRIASPRPGVVTIVLGRDIRSAAMAVQPDGTIAVAATLVAGPSAQGVLLRVTPAGRLSDPGLTPIAGVIMNVWAMIVAADGKIVVVRDGYKKPQSRGDFLVARFLANGAPDTSFGQGGWTLTDVGEHEDINVARGVAVQGDGRIVVTGSTLVRNWLLMTAYSFATVRFNVDGSLDKSFGHAGRVVTRMGVSREDRAQVVLIQADGKLVVAGTADSATARTDVALARYLPTGQLDPQFGHDGKAGPVGTGHDSAAYTAALAPDGRIVVGGFLTVADERPQRDLVSRAPMVARYTREGHLDPTFGAHGVRALAAGGNFAKITAVALQRDGKIVATGRQRLRDCNICFGAIRLNPDGGADPTFAHGDFLPLPFAQFMEDPSTGSLAIQRDGRILIMGLLRGNPPRLTLIRLTPDGTPDTTFGSNLRTH